MKWHLDRWQSGDGQKRNHIPVYSISKFDNNKVASTFWIENGDFLRLQSVQLGYTLPAL